MKNFLPEKQGLFSIAETRPQLNFRIVKHFMLLITLLGSTLVTYAGSGIFQTYVIFDRGSGNEYRAGGINSDAGTPFSGIDIGSFVYGATLKLNGGK